MKNKIIFLLLLLLSFTTNMWAQVGIGTSSPNSNAVLELSSTTQGMKFPKMTTTERNAIASPAKGLTVFDTDLNCLMVNFGTTSSANWKCVGGVSSSHPSTNGTGIVSAYTCDTASTGTMTQGIATGSGVTQTITATVTAVGSYNISTTINGITFSGSGYFVATGDRTVLLTATGTPTLGGLHTFTLNTTPNCSFTRSTGPIPGVISLATVSNTYIASVYDVDYLPYTPPTTTATTATSVASDGVSEATTIDFQGSITTTGKTIYIIVSATASGTLPAYTSPTITIPAEFTEDNTSRDLKLSWASQSFTSTDKRITAKIEAIGGTLNLKKLDLNTGNGNDNLGVLIGSLSYIRNNANDLGTLNLRLMPGIPDKMFGVADNNSSTTSHLMLYLPIEAEDGNTWLNHNLGAHYTKISHANFNPNQQATSSTDYLAYGSLFQWGRKADGHELINFASSTSGTPVTTAVTATLSDNPSDAKIIQAEEWRVTPDNTLWASESSANNPCPTGYIVPDETQIFNLFSVAAITDSNRDNHILKLSASGTRYYNLTGVSIPVIGGAYYRTRSASVPGKSGTRAFNAGASTARGNGCPVRCIKN